METGRSCSSPPLGFRLDSGIGAEWGGRRRALLGCGVGAGGRRGLYRAETINVSPGQRSPSSPPGAGFGVRCWRREGEHTRFPGTLFHTLHLAPRPLPLLTPWDYRGIPTPETGTSLSGSASPPRLLPLPGPWHLLTASSAALLGAGKRPLVPGRDGREVLAPWESQVAHGACLSGVIWGRSFQSPSQPLFGFSG